MLTREQLIEKLGNAEDNSVERKSNGVNRQELRKTISAFANSMEIDHCGVLFIGVAEQEKATHFEPSKLDAPARATQALP